MKLKITPVLAILLACSHLHGQSFYSDLISFYNQLNNEKGISFDVRMDTYKNACDERAGAQQMMHYTRRANDCHIKNNQYDLIFSDSILVSLFHSTQYAIVVHRPNDNGRNTNDQIKKMLYAFISEQPHVSVVDSINQIYYVQPTNPGYERILFDFNSKGLLSKIEIINDESTAQQSGEKVVYEFSNYAFFDANEFMKIDDVIMRTENSWTVSDKFKDYSLIIQ